MDDGPFFQSTAVFIRLSDCRPCNLNAEVISLLLKRSSHHRLE